MRRALDEIESKLPGLARSCGTSKLVANLDVIEANRQRNVEIYQRACAR